MGDFKEDPRFEVVYEDGRPSYFRENNSTTGATVEAPAATHIKTEETPAAPRLSGPSESSNIRYVYAPRQSTYFSQTLRQPGPPYFLTILNKVSLHVKHGLNFPSGDVALAIVGIFVYSLVIFLIGGISYSGSLETSARVGGAILFLLAVLLAPFVVISEARMLRKMSS